MPEPYLHFGGQGPLIHLATANGFPPEAYRPLAELLTDRYRLAGYRCRPLRTDQPAETLRHWHELAADMLADLDHLAPDAPIIAMGHSLGGIMSVYAALWQPWRFRALILIDPVLLPRNWLPFIWLLRKLGYEAHSPLARGAARRRTRFPDQLAAFKRYQGRGIFADFTPAALQGYIEGGMCPHPAGGVTLAWPNTWESRIFALVPVDTWHAVGQLRLPFLLVRGRNSDLIIDRSWRRLQRCLPHARLLELPGGHMLPMEHPATVARAAAEFLADIE
jgi:pimeloyl-ACP methyl ester carboxylesterase